MHVPREEQALPAKGEARRVEGRGRIERDHERGLATVFGPLTRQPRLTELESPGSGDDG
jgi:hypothetical protein